VQDASHRTKCREAAARFRRVRATVVHAGLGIALAVAIGCDNAAGPPPVGSLQLPALPGDVEVGGPVQVRVVALDDLGAALPGAVLRFVPTDGSGSVTPMEATSGVDGSVSVVWQLSTVAGVQQVLVQANGADGQLSIQATPGAATQIVASAGTGQSGPVGEPLPEPITVVVTDVFGNPTSAVAISVAVQSGAGSVDASNGLTDAGGRFSTRWTLGEPLGPQGLLIQFEGGGSGVPVSASGTPGLASSLAIISGNNQSGTVGALLAEPLVVRTFDRFGNPTMASPVTFSDPAGGGAVPPPPSVQPDGEGHASTAWTLSTIAGAGEVIATVPDGASQSFSVTAAAGPATTLVKVSGDAQQGPATRALAAPIVARVHDQYGNSVSGTTVAFGIVSGSGAVAPPQVSSDADGVASAQWTLGPALGPNGVSVSVPGQTGIGTIEFAAQATSLPPAEIQMVSGDGQTTEVGTAVTSAPVVRVLDSAGNPVPGVAVVFSIASGGGSVSGSSPITDATGTAAVGGWTLGSSPGTNTLHATLEALTPVVFTATALPGPPTQLDKIAGDGQTANVGTPVGVAPTVRISDALGNPIAGVGVTFAVTGGAGSIAGPNPTTGADGRASLGSWTLGPNVGANSVSAAAAGLTPVTFDATGSTTPPGFTTEIQFVGSSTGSQQAIVLSAANRWNSVITGDVPDFTANLSAGACGVGHSAYNGIVDDVVIFVEIVPIDGTGGVLGSAGPCWLRSGSMLPIFGSVRLDSDDVAALEASGRLFDVVVHEIGHVLGIGTLWGTTGLLQGAGGADPYYSGTNAIQEFQAIGGTHPNPVPVENTGGSGTRDAHWRESVMTSELMTGWLSGGINPLSRVTVGSLEDQGYTVDYGAADGFVTTAPGPGAPVTIQLIEVPMPAPIIVP